MGEVTVPLIGSSGGSGAAVDTAGTAAAERAAAEAAVPRAGIPSILTPITLENLAITATAAIGVAFRGLFQRAIVRKTGILKSLWVLNGTTVAGSTRAAVTDLGVTTPEKYTFLYEGAEVVMAGAEVWQKLGEPNLAVTRGQELLLGIMTSSTTATFGKNAAYANAGAAELPEGFAPVAGLVKPKLGSFHLYGSLAFSGIGANLTEAQLTKGGQSVAIIGNIE